MKKELLKSSFLNLLSAIFSKGSAIVISIIFARVLGAEIFGTFSIIQTTTATLLIFITVGAGVVITKHVSIYNENNEQESALAFTLLNILISSFFSIIFIFITFLYSKQISEYLLNDQNQSVLIKIAVFIPLLSCIQVVINGYMNGKKDFRYNKNVSLVSGVISIPISLYLVLNHALLGGVVSLLINQIIIVILYINYFYKQFNGDVSSVFENIIFNYNRYKKIIVNDSFPALLVGLTVTPTMLLIYQISMKYNTSGLEIVGQFGAITQWRNLLIFIPSVLGVVFLSYFSRYKDNEKYRLYNLLTPYFCVYSIVIFLLAFPGFLKYIYGHDFVNEDFIRAFYVVIISCLLVSVKSAIGREIVFKENYWVSAVSNLIWSISFVGIYLIYGVEKGSFGIAISFLLSHLISFIYFLYRVDYSRELLKKFLSQQSVMFSLLILTVLSVRLYL